MKRFVSQLLVLFSVLISSPCCANYTAAQRQRDACRDKEFVFIVPMYNNAPWYEMCLSSIFRQTYSKYRVIVIDDCSTDGTAELVEQYVRKKGQHHRVTLIRNSKRLMQLANRYNAAHKCANHEVLIMLDGDDFLARDDVLTLLNKKYKDPGVWLVYGQFIRWCHSCADASLEQKVTGVRSCKHVKRVGWPHPLFPRNSKVLRTMSGRTKTNGGAIHLRTFYAKLFKRIPLKALLIEGAFFPRSTEVATSYPLLEMAGQRIGFIPEILMYLNRQNALSCMNIYTTDPMHARFSRRHFSKEIRKRTTLKPVAHLDPYKQSRTSIDCIIIDDAAEGDIQMVHRLQEYRGSSVRVLVVAPETECTVVRSFLGGSTASSVVLIQDGTIIPSIRDIKRCVCDVEKTHAMCGVLQTTHQCISRLLQAEHVDIAQDAHAIQLNQYPGEIPSAYAHAQSVVRRKEIEDALATTPGDMNSFIKAWRERRVNGEEVCVFYSDTLKDAS